ncbi:hypothetical protein ABFV99_13855 [Cytobacillus horneckiae]|uniref:hypothetical protein n=1 Tax=Cytobacillus horneckiae TaxID=549687 RepID=UPI0034CDD44C
MFVDKKSVVRSLLHLINNLSTGERHIICDYKEVIITDKKVMNIGSEVTIPHMLSEEVQNQNPSYFSKQVEILMRYLKIKSERPLPNSINNNESFKYSRRRNNAISKPYLDFFDFYIVDMAYNYTFHVLDSNDQYGYEHVGYINIASETAFYIFTQIHRSGYGEIQSSSTNLHNYPGGIYGFKEGTNISSFIEQRLPHTEGIYEYEEDDEEDEFEEFVDEPFI